MDEPTVVHDNSSNILSTNKSHDSNNSQIKSESTSISNENFQSTHNKSSNDINNAISRLSINDIPPQNRSHSARLPSSSYDNQSETQAQLVAFTQPLMSIQVPYRQSQPYQHKSYRPRASMYNSSHEQTSKTKSEKSISQPEYYVDSFASNFSDKPSSNSNTKPKTKHVTFQEPEPFNESPKMISQQNNFPRSLPIWTQPVQMYPTQRPFNRYYNHNQYYPQQFYPPYHNNIMMNQGFIPRGMNMIPTSPAWMPGLYYPNQYPPQVYQPSEPKQLYDPNKPRVSSTSDSNDSSKILRNIPPKNKKKIKETNTSTTEPVPPQITILRKPNTFIEVLTTSVEDKPIEDHSDIPSKEEQSLPSSTQIEPITDTSSESNSTLSLPSHEILSILQSANCISSLNEYAQQKKFTLNYEFSSPTPSLYACILSINNRQFPTSSSYSSKTEAQKSACDQALRILYQESCPNDQSSIKFSTKHDCIAHRSISTFQQLNVNELLHGRKTLACMLMITNGEYDQARVISIATGNSCLDEINLSYADDGTSLHDCHAEILARRGLIKYFFQQIQQSKSNQSSIFEYNSTDNKYQLRENITFHMYISSLPCGTASLDISSLNSIRYKQGQSEGTLNPSSINSIKYPIKSCSDKIYRWNILGIQGGLLINFLTKPIYLQTITLACETTFDRNHVKYSLCERLNEYIQSLPSPYLIHIPDINCPTIKSFQQERQVAKLQSNAFVWNITKPDKSELLEPITGRLKHDRSISSLSKRNLFEDFLNLYSTNDTCLNYHQAKQLDTNYITVKNLISTAFQSGSSDINIPWLSKTDQLEQFSIQ